MRSGLLWVGVLLIGLRMVACSTSPKSPSDAQRDVVSTPDSQDAPKADAQDSTDCRPIYRAPGCTGDIGLVCDDGRGGACGGAVCDCTGKIQLSFCDRAYQRFAYFVPPPQPGQDAGLTCDPNADAGRGH
jgi:hypothetical protein